MTKKSQRAGRRGLPERELSWGRPRSGHGPGVSGHHSRCRGALRAEARRDLREAGPVHPETCRERWQVPIKSSRSDGKILAIKGQRIFRLCRPCGLCHSYATWLLSIKTNTSEWVQLGSNTRTVTSLEVDQIWPWLVACQPLFYGPRKSRYEGRGWGCGEKWGESGATLLPSHPMGYSMWDLHSPAELVGD